VGEPASIEADRPDAEALRGVQTRRRQRGLRALGVAAQAPTQLVHRRQLGVAQDQGLATPWPTCMCRFASHDPGNWNLWLNPDVSAMPERRRRYVAAVPAELKHDTIHHADNMDVLPGLPAEAFQLVYIDPPFNTGGTQARRTLAMVPDEDGDRTGFKGVRYRTRLLAESSYRDAFEDYLAFLEPRLREARRLLHASGTLYFHIDYREAHYCKLLLDELFGREQFLNELIWAYDYGARTRRRWPAKHDTILVYVKDVGAYFFDGEAVDREPYMAPGLVTPEKAARGKLPTDVWWHTIVPTNGREKTGYPTQKPEGIVRRMVQASTRPGDWCLDFFAGSGTLGAVAAQLDRHYVLIDESPDAVAVMRRRLPGAAFLAGCGSGGDGDVGRSGSPPRQRQAERP
jgi:site-specific DNA-methyltransferase (adenine-specific)